MKTRKFFTLLLKALVAMLFLLPACGTPVEPQDTQETVVVKEKVEDEDEDEDVEAEAETSSRGQGDTLRLLYWQAPSILNPYISDGLKDAEAAALILEPLAHYDEDGNMVPRLVDEIPTVENGGISEDLTSITWTLSEGIMWSDGTPLTAQDVAFTATYCMTPETGCTEFHKFDGIETIEALDDRRVKMTYVAPKPYPYSPLLGGSTPILQKAQFKDCLGAKASECTDENFAPIGTGPYKIREFKPNDVVIYDVNETYREPNKPYFSEVILKGGGDAASAARAVLETGEADFAWNTQIEPQILEEMEAAGKGKLVVAFGSLVESLMINFTNPSPELGDKRSEWTKDDPNPHPFLSDLAVRQALSMAIDRTAIASELYGFIGEPACNMVLAPPVYLSPNNDDCVTQDIEGAKALLDQAGWLPGDDGIRQKDGIRLNILYQASTNSVRQSTQALIKQWWREIGVETELRNIDAAVFFGGDPASPDTREKFYADIEMYTNGFGGANPEPYMKKWTCEEIANSENNWSGNNLLRWCNESGEEYQALVDKLAQASKIEERAQLVIQMNDILIQDVAIIPLVNRGGISAHSNTISGIRLSGWGVTVWNIADWTRSSE